MQKILAISRPRFWMYTLGPFLVGSVSLFGFPYHFPLEFFVFLVYFTFPANIFIYGINDIYDRATDMLNAKKQGYEQVLKPEYDGMLRKVIAFSNIPFWIYAVVVLPPVALILFAVFVFLSWQYSAPPIRAKAVPFLDSIFSGFLYIVPGAVMWAFLFTAWPPMLAIIGGFLWSFAMHAYSAVPDIQADREAGIATGATLLGKQGILAVCAILYALAGVIGAMYVGPFAYIAGGIYVALVGVSMYKKTPAEVLGIYKLFPVINTVIGGVLFFLLVV